MKKVLFGIVLSLVICSTVLASPQCHDRYEHHNPPPPPVVLLNTEVTVRETPFLDCDRHFLSTQTTTNYYSDGTASSSNSYSVFDKEGNVLITNSHAIRHITYGQEHYFIVNNNYLLSENNLLLSDSNRYQSIEVLDNNRLLVKKDGKYGIITFSKTPILPIVYKSIKSIGNGLFIVKVNGAFGIYNINGQCILPTDNEKISKLGDTYYKVKKDNKYGVVDVYGRVLSQPIYKKVKLERNILQVSFDGNRYQVVNY